MLIFLSSIWIRVMKQHFDETFKDCWIESEPVRVCTPLVWTSASPHSQISHCIPDRDSDLRCIKVTECPHRCSISFNWQLKSLPLKKHGEKLMKSRALCKWKAKCQFHPSDVRDHNLPVRITSRVWFEVDVYVCLVNDQLRTLAWVEVQVSWSVARL